jgi:hypothetical protein
MSQRTDPWTSALIRFGEMSREEARFLGERLLSLPAPSSDAKHYLTNNFLKSMGIDSPAHRARIMLAASRCPPAIDHEENMSIDERAVAELSVARNALRDAFAAGDRRARPSRDGAGAAGATRSPLTYPDTSASGAVDALASVHAADDAAFVSRDARTVVARRFHARGSRWIDVSGIDMARGDADVERVAGTNFFKATSLVHEAINTTKMRRGTEPSSPSSIVVTLEPVHVDLASASVKPETVAALKEAAAGTTVRDGMFTAAFCKEITTPIFLENDDQANAAAKIGCMVLLVPRDVALYALDVDEESLREASAASLTDRWLIYVNATALSIATVHAADTPGLAMLRSRWVHDGALAHSTTADVAPSLGQAANAPSAAAAAAADEASLALDSADEHDAFADQMADIFGTFLNEFEVVLDDCDGIMDEIEANLKDKRGGQAMAADLHFISRRAAVYERMLANARRVIDDATDTFDVSNACSRIPARFDHLAARSNNAQGRALNLMNLVIALAGYHTSDAFNVLTMISGALLPLGYVATHYGTNWRTFPELRWEYSYFVYVLVLIALFVVMVFYLRSKGL